MTIGLTIIFRGAYGTSAFTTVVPGHVAIMRLVDHMHECGAFRPEISANR